MISAITLTLLVLVAFNFMLLFVSTNKITKTTKRNNAALRHPKHLEKAHKTVQLKKIQSGLSQKAS
jgi:hypothetical protein